MASIPSKIKKLRDSKLYFKGLNGIRSIAAMGVVFSHIGNDLNEFGLKSFKGLQLAAYGVTMFFALSGFLITYLLLQESAKGTINIKKFYIRRVLRIWPLYFLYLIISVIIIKVFEIFPIKFELLFYTFLAANVPVILKIYIPLITHYWSLGVEEQFYLFWPWIIKKIKSPVYYILSGIISILLFKLFLKYYENQLNLQLISRIIQITRFQCMAIGSLGAFILFDNKAKILSFIQLMPVQVIAWLCFLLVAINKFNFLYTFSQEIIAVATVVIIINVSQNAKTIINLENKVFVFLGKISYGIYVIHPLIIFCISKLLKNAFNSLPLGLHYFIIYTLIIFLTIIFSYLSYYYFELFFLKIKERKFTTIESTNS